MDRILYFSAKCWRTCDLAYSEIVRNVRDTNRFRSKYESILELGHPVPVELPRALPHEGAGLRPHVLVRILWQVGLDSERVTLILRTIGYFHAILNYLNPQCVSLEAGAPRSHP